MVVCWCNVVWIWVWMDGPVRRFVVVGEGVVVGERVLWEVRGCCGR